MRSRQNCSSHPCAVRPASTEPAALRADFSSYRRSRAQVLLNGRSRGPHRVTDAGDPADGLTETSHCVSALKGAHAAPGVAPAGMRSCGASHGSVDVGSEPVDIGLSGVATGVATRIGSATLTGALFQSAPVIARLRHALFPAIKPGLRARGASFQSERSLANVDGVALRAGVSSRCVMGRQQRFAHSGWRAAQEAPSSHRRAPRLGRPGYSGVVDMDRRRCRVAPLIQKRDFDRARSSALAVA